MTLTAHASNGARLVTPTGESLPLARVTLTATAQAGIARTHLHQHFTNPHPVPLELTYAFALPVDGAVAGYEIRAGQRIIRGRVERREEARAHFEQARLEGRTAGLVEQERPNLFTQRLGNIPAHTDVIVELTIDHPVRWVSGFGWEWRFPTVVAPRYLGGDGAVADADRVTVDVVNGVTSPTAAIHLSIGDELDAAPTSATHAIAAVGGTVTLAGEAHLDRDIAIRWPAPEVTSCALHRARPVTANATGEVAYGLLTLAAPTRPAEHFARDLILLLDVSGSMTGRPIEKMKAIVTTLIEQLGDEDRLEMIAFASRQERYRRQPVRATADEKRRACDWVEALAASGATEMIHAIGEALRPLRPGVPRQVVVVTDGLIGFEADAVRAIRDGLPPGSRLHTVGVGSATNREFLRPAARAGRGVEVMVDLHDITADAAQRLVAATREPLVVDLAVEGTALADAGPRLPDLLAGSPVLAPVRLRPEGGTLVVRGRTARDAWEARIEVPATLPGEGSAAIPALWAREAIDELDLNLACDGDRQGIDARIEAIALEFSIASRLTSWVAIAEEPSVDPREPVRLERIPQSLPYGMSAEGLGLAGQTAVLGAPEGATYVHGLTAGASFERLASDASVSLPPVPLGEATPPASQPPRTLGKFREWFRKSLEHAGRPGARRLALRFHGRAFATPGRPTTTVEILLAQELEWRVPVEAALGGRVVAVVPDGTTRPGPIAANSIVRVELAAVPRDVAGGQLAIVTGDVTLLVEIEASI